MDLKLSAGHKHNGETGNSLQLVVLPTETSITAVNSNNSLFLYNIQHWGGPNVLLSLCSTWKVEANYFSLLMLALISTRCNLVVVLVQHLLEKKGTITADQ